VSGLSVKGTISPHNDKKADNGVKVFYSMAYCLNRISGVFVYISISINEYKLYQFINFHMQKLKKMAVKGKNELKKLKTFKLMPIFELDSV
jgi:hypothetical protein